MMGRKFVALVIAGLAAMGALVISPGQAQACSWTAGGIEYVMPEIGAQISPQTQFSIWFVRGGPAELNFELSDEAGDIIDTDTDRIRVSERSVEELDHRIVTPLTDLEVGEHTLRIYTDDDLQFGDENGDMTSSTTMSFEVVDEAPPEEPAVIDGIHWTRTEIGGGMHDSCYSPEREQWHEVDITHGESERTWYEITYEGEGETVVASQPSAEAFRHHLNFGVDCISVEAVGLDGQRSELVESCMPDACQLQTGYDAGDIDDASCLPDDDFDEGDDVADPNESACATGGGALPSLLVAVLIFGLVAVLRRRPKFQQV